MIDLVRFKPGDKPEEWLPKLYKFLETNPWLDLLLSGKLVPKGQKNTFAVDAEVFGNLILHQQLQFLNAADDAVAAYLYAASNVLNMYLRATAGSAFTIYDKDALAVFTATTGYVRVLNTLITGSGAGAVTVNPYGSSSSSIISAAASGGLFLTNTEAASRVYVGGPWGMVVRSGSVDALVINNEGACTFYNSSTPDSSARTLKSVNSNLTWQGSIIETRAGKHYGEMYAYENATAATITQANVYHALQGSGIGAGLLSGVTFTAGIVGAIASAADYSGTVAGTVLLTDVAHGLTTGDIITIHDSTDYDGVFQITKVTDDTFRITTTWGADRTGVWHRGARLVIGTAGDYRLSMSLTAFAAVANKTIKFELFKNTTSLDNAAVSRKFSTTDYTPMATSGFATLAANDQIWVAAMNQTDGSDITVRHINVNLERMA